VSTATRCPSGTCRSPGGRGGLGYDPTPATGVLLRPDYGRQRAYHDWLTCGHLSVKVAPLPGHYQRSPSTVQESAQARRVCHSRTLVVMRAVKPLAGLPVRPVESRLRA
jgi:hypothetical protein